MPTAESAMSQRFFTDPPRGVLRIGPPGFEPRRGNSERDRHLRSYPVSLSGNGLRLGDGVKRLPTPSRQSLQENVESDDPLPVERHFPLVSAQAAALNPEKMNRYA